MIGSGSSGPSGGQPSRITGLNQSKSQTGLVKIRTNVGGADMQGGTLYKQGQTDSI